MKGRIGRARVKNEFIDWESRSWNGCETHRTGQGDGRRRNSRGLEKKRRL